MPTLLPFIPNGAITEALEWSTDVIKTKTTEKRLARREIPRRTFTMNFLLTPEKYAAALSIIRADDAHYVPDWPQHLNVGAVASGTNVVVNVSTTATTLSSGDLVVIWDSWDIAEVCTATTVTGTSITLDSVSGTYSAARIMPALNCQIKDGIQFDRSAGGVVYASLSATTFTGADITASTLSQYQGKDLISAAPVVGSGSVSAKVGWQYSELDNQTGIPSLTRERTDLNNELEQRWYLKTYAENLTLRKWLYSVRGKQKSFWMASKTNDIEAIASISGTNITAYDHPQVSLYGRTANFDIEIEETNGTLHQRRTTNLSAGAPVFGRNTVTITVDSALSITLSNIKRISFLYCVRLNADRVEFNYEPAAGSTLAVPCLEVDE